MARVGHSIACSNSRVNEVFSTEAILPETDCAAAVCSKEIGVLLGIAVKTAESKRARLMQKQEIHMTATLVRYAVRQKIVQPEDRGEQGSSQIPSTEQNLRAINNELQWLSMPNCRPVRAIWRAVAESGSSCNRRSVASTRTSR